jgi:hypothetical protein
MLKVRVIVLDVGVIKNPFHDAALVVIVPQRKVAIFSTRAVVLIGIVSFASRRSRIKKHLDLISL